MATRVADSEDELICLGRIKGPHGLDGAVRLTSFTEHAEDIASYGPLSDQSGGRQFEIRSLRAARDGLVVRLAGVSDRNGAEALKGVELFVPRSRLGTLDGADDTWFYTDLIGLDAVLADGTPFGTVMAVQDFGAGDLLDIRPADGGNNVFIPFTHDAVPDVDLPAGRVTIVPPEGLLEEKAAKKEPEQ